jgi:DNA repair protein RadC
MPSNSSNPERKQSEGHRQRVKSQYLQGGLESFSDSRALELLLFYALPRKDTYPLACRLLERFGSFCGVLEAPIEELRQVEGMTEHAAILLTLNTDASRRCLVARAQAHRILRTIDDCGEYLMPCFYGCRDEQVYLLSLDAKGHPLGCRLIGKGSVNSANVPVRKIVAAALSINATAVVLAHNHPSGIALPSQEDIQATEQVRSALDAVGIQLVDHIIAAEDDFVSMKQSGYLE